jgi:hypothetical protein
MKLTTAFCLVSELAGKMGVKSIKDLGKPWEYRIDDKWEIAVNGMNTVQEVKSPKNMGATLQPYHMAVFHNGWLAALLTPFGGTFLNDSEDEFISAVEAKINEI